MPQSGIAGPSRSAFFASRLFLRLFLSYVSIVCAAFVLYSAFVVTEGAARNVASRVRSSIIIRDLYLNLKYAGRTVDLTEPYNSIQELKSARSTASNIGIYDVLLFLSGDPRVFSSSVSPSRGGASPANWA
jgi:hypothetical protein